MAMDMIMVGGGIPERIGVGGTRDIMGEGIIRILTGRISGTGIILILGITSIRIRAEGIQDPRYPVRACLRRLACPLLPADHSGECRRPAALAAAVVPAAAVEEEDDVIIN
jgi:hypothetical protein